jgi:hypothetical protein
MLNLNKNTLIDISSNPFRKVEPIGLATLYFKDDVLAHVAGTSIENIKGQGCVNESAIRYGAIYGSTRIGDFLTICNGRYQNTCVYEPLVSVGHELIQPANIANSIFYGQLSAEQWAAAEKIHSYPHIDMVKTWFFQVPYGYILIDLIKGVAALEGCKLWHIKAYALCEERWERLFRDPRFGYHYFKDESKAFINNVLICEPPNPNFPELVEQYEVSKNLHETFRYVYEYLSLSPQSAT